MWTVVAIAAAAAALVVARPLATAEPGSVSTADASTGTTAEHWTPYTPARLAQLAAAGPVFVDFTAAWFGQRKVTLMRADWTRRDPDITRALAALGRNGVPVYVLYRPGQEPLLLPEVLTTTIVHDALATLGGPALALSENPR
jgi:thiol:disulfide interchange protein DsbD